MNNQTSVLSDADLEQASGGFTQVAVAMVVLGLTLFGTVCAAYPSSGPAGGPSGMRRGST